MYDIQQGFCTACTRQRHTCTSIFQLLDAGLGLLDYRLKMASTNGIQRTEKTQFNIPIPQPAYHFVNDTWTPVTCPSTPTSTSTSEAHNPYPKIRLITWNIDFGAPAPQERMARALQHLDQQTTPSPAETETENKAKKPGTDRHGNIPYIICLQEMTEPDLEQIQNADWVRDRFVITDLSDRYWGGLYGTTTLVDKRLSVQRVFRVLYSASRMQRDGLFVDIAVGESMFPPSQPPPLSYNYALANLTETIRFCNTHLESLVSSPPRRPAQLRLVSEYLHTSGSAELPTPHAGVVAGDMNAFAAEDRTLPDENDFLDAFLVLGGKEDSDDGYTWGLQVPDHVRLKFGCSRMDKVLFCGRMGALELKKFGEGVRAWVEYPKESDEEEDKEGEEVWVTDHIGLEAVLKVA